MMDIFISDKFRGYFMDINLDYKQTILESTEIIVLSAFSKKGEKSSVLSINHWDKEIIKSFKNVDSSAFFKGGLGENFFFNLDNGQTILVLGLGEKKSLTFERLRREIATMFKLVSKKNSNLVIDIDGMIVKGSMEKTVACVSESLTLTSYFFDKYKSKKSSQELKVVTLYSKDKTVVKDRYKKALSRASIISESVNISRDFVNEIPNFLNSEMFAKLVEKDAKGVSGVKVKVLGREQLKKEKMNLFLSVNAGSKFAPRLVHLTYTPKIMNSKTKHVVLVGKGLTFDTGGYSLKPSASMVNMKFDMAGAATVYGAFRAAALLAPKTKITCVLGMTDNALSVSATMPDSIITGRSGATVEILNTDAEGRLVLADCLDYACDLKPNAIIDCATLTGAVLVSLGTEICGVMGNNGKLTKDLISSAKSVDEYMWQLPIIDEFRDDIKSSIADIKNIGSSRFGGTSKAAAFLQHFIKDDIAWAHLDIAGIGDSQSHLPYCPKKGASGLIVRTLVDYLTNV